MNHRAQIPRELCKCTEDGRVSRTRQVLRGRPGSKDGRVGSCRVLLVVGGTSSAARGQRTRRLPTPEALGDAIKGRIDSSSSIREYLAPSHSPGILLTAAPDPAFLLFRTLGSRLFV